MSAPAANMLVRPFRPADLGFVEEMLVSAALPPGPLPPRMTEELRLPHVARWFVPRIGQRDIAVVIESSAGVALGAAVGRCFASIGGALAPDVPELAMAVRQESRSQGVGRVLLEGWLTALRARGHSSASLTVSLLNVAALRLYERCGFREVSRDERRSIMRWSARLPA